MYAIKVTPSKYKPHDFYLLRDMNDFVVHVWTRKEEAEKALARIDDASCVITQDIPKAALDRAVEKKQRMREAK